MKYLCLVYHEETKVDAMSESEYDAIVSQVLASKMPPTRLGCIEVRPVRELDPKNRDPKDRARPQEAPCHVRHEENPDTP